MKFYACENFPLYGHFTWAYKIMSSLYSRQKVYITPCVKVLSFPSVTCYSFLTSLFPSVDEIIKLGTTKVDELEKEVEEEVKSGSYGSWHFFTIILVLATVVIGGYLCVHNRKKVNTTSFVPLTCTVLLTCV